MPMLTFQVNRLNHRFRKSWVLALAGLLALTALLAACFEPTSEPTPAPTPDIPAILQAEIASYAAGLPTATPYPTGTPYPTSTPYPTGTPYPTATPYPTGTPYPTATPWPTNTPHPTATPYPTYTPAPIETGVSTTTAAPVPTIMPTPIPPLRFDIFTTYDRSERAEVILRGYIYHANHCDEIIELNREFSKEHDVELLKVYEKRLVINTSNKVECSGRAKWSEGEDTSVFIFVMNDGDGDFFYGYRRPSQ